jgi:hypothetical protein
VPEDADQMTLLPSAIFPTVPPMRRTSCNGTPSDLGPTGSAWAAAGSPLTTVRASRAAATTFDIRTTIPFRSQLRPGP